MGAVKVIQELFPEPGRVQFIYADLGDAVTVSLTFSFITFETIARFSYWFASKYYTIAFPSLTSISG